MYQEENYGFCQHRLKMQEMRWHFHCIIVPVSLAADAFLQQQALCDLIIRPREIALRGEIIRGLFSPVDGRLQRRELLSLHVWFQTKCMHRFGTTFMQQQALVSIPSSLEQSSSFLHQLHHI